MAYRVIHFFLPFLFLPGLFFGTGEGVAQSTTSLTGISVPAMGKWIDPDSVAKPRVVKATPPQIVSAPSNVHRAGKPRVIPIPDKLNIIIPGKNGIPLPKESVLKGEAVSIIQPKPLPALPPRMKDAARYDIQYLDVEQGMISSLAYNMLEDSQGNLWFGTFEGISRYDAESFTNYTMNEGLSANWVCSMLEDRHGNLWFGTRDGVLNCYDGVHLVHYTAEEGSSRNPIWTMLEDSQGNIWVGTGGGGVSCLRFGNGQSSFTHYTTREGLSNDRVISILEDSQGSLWFGTRGGGVNRYEPDEGPGSFTHYSTREGLSHNNVYSIVEDSRGNIWFGTDGGVCRYDLNDGRESFTHFTTEEGLSSNAVWAILEDSRGNLWFGTGGRGVSCYVSDGEEGSFTHYTTKEGLSGNIVYFIWEDGLGKLWFGTDGGVSCFDVKSFSQYTFDEGYPFNYVHAVLEDGHGKLWFGTDGGVCRFDGVGLAQYTTEEGLSGNDVYSMLEDSRGNLWFGTLDGGLNRYVPDDDRGSFTYYTTKEGLSHNVVLSMLEDRQGDLWFGTRGGGVSRYSPGDEGGSFTHFTTKEGLSHNIVFSILEDSRGDLWFGTRGGASRYDGSTFKQHTHNEGFGENAIFSMLEDSRGNIWFGTDNGACRYTPDNEGGNYIRYTTAEGLGNNIVVSIIEDGKGNLWMSTQKGITVLIPLSSSSSFPSGSKKEHYQFLTFDINDGLKKLNFERNSVRLDQHNRIWWGTKGLTVLDLNQFEVHSQPPQLKLEHIELEQTFIDFRRLSDTAYCHSLSFGPALTQAFDSVAPSVNYPASLSLPYDISDIAFYLTAIDWTAPHKVRYSYMLEGLDEQWSLPTKENKIEYRNLPYGDFSFKARAIGEAQAWSKTFTYRFTILPPWYRTWWAYTLWAALILGILSWFYRFQLNRQLALAETQRLKELDQVKTRLYTNITHEFRTPLSIILGMANQMKNDPQNWYNEGLRLIWRNGKQLLNLINQMLDLSKLESGQMPLKLINGDVASFLQYIFESFHSYADSKDIRLHFMSDHEELHIDFDPEKLQNVVSNLLSNAIKFTPAGGNVYLGLRLEKPAEKNLQLQIKDDGIGIEPEYLPFIFDRFYQGEGAHIRRGEGTGIGLALVKELVKAMDGKIEVESIRKKGTNFTILLPITQTAEKMQPETGPEIYQPLGSALLSDTEKKPDITDMSQGGRHLVLLVEDNEDVLTYLTSFLSVNYQIVIATDGQKGIDKALELIPDLIVSDVMMPEKDGYELCAALKTNERTSHIPIILLTAKSGQASKIEGLTVGADAYLAKPFNQEELLVRIDKLIELRRQMQKRFQRSGALFQTLKSPVKTKEEAFLQKVLEIIERNMKDENFGMPQLCKELHISRSHLFRKLKAVTGKSATHLIRSMRLEKAKELLVSSHMNVTEVCFEVGFNNPGYFSMAFQEEFGVSPSAFRKS